MKTIVHVLAALSIVVAAAPARAHTASQALPRHTHDFEAFSPRLQSPSGELHAPLFGDGDETRGSATGGPSGGLPGNS